MTTNDTPKTIGPVPTKFGPVSLTIQSSVSVWIRLEKYCVNRVTYGGGVQMRLKSGQWVIDWWDSYVRRDNAINDRPTTAAANAIRTELDKTVPAWIKNNLKKKDFQQVEIDALNDEIDRELDKIAKHEAKLKELRAARAALIG